jgi:hypothetical protein
LLLLHCRARRVKGVKQADEKVKDVVKNVFNKSPRRG